MPKSWGFHQVIPMFLKVPYSLEGASRTPNNSLEPRERPGIFVHGRVPGRYAAPQRTRGLRRTPIVAALEWLERSVG